MNYVPTIIIRYRRFLLINLLVFFCAFSGLGQTKKLQTSIRELVYKLQQSKIHTLPYGFNFDQNASAKQVDSMNARMFADLENQNRIELLIDVPLQRLLLKSDAKTNQLIKVYSGPTKFRVLQLSQSGNFSLYSLMASEQMDCNNCEYGWTQTVNVLLTTHNNLIIDHRVIAFDSGNDLSKNHRYFYLDSKKRLFIRDFFGDEEGVVRTGVYNWMIDRSGKFILVRK